MKCETDGNDFPMIVKLTNKHKRVIFVNQGIGLLFVIGVSLVTEIRRSETSRFCITVLEMCELLFCWLDSINQYLECKLN